MQDADVIVWLNHANAGEYRDCQNADQQVTAAQANAPPECEIFCGNEQNRGPLLNGQATPPELATAKECQIRADQPGARENRELLQARERSDRKGKISQYACEQAERNAHENFA